jgi:chaperonin cofactor prefoldin
VPTLEERIAALEAKVDAHAMSASDLRGTLAALQDQMNRRFEQVDHRFVELLDQMNRRFEQIDRRFEQVDRRFEQVDHRFADLQGQMNHRFDAVDQKIDRHFTWLVGIQVAALLAVVGALVGSYYR